MAMQKQLTNLFINATGVGVLGGISAFILTMLFGAVGTNIWAGVIVSLLIIVAIIWLSKSAKVDNLTFVNFVVYFAAIALVGTIITTVFPPAKGYILAFNDNLTVSGLMYTILYISIAENVIRMFR